MTPHLSVGLTEAQIYYNVMVESLHCFLQHYSHLDAHCSFMGQHSTLGGRCVIFIMREKKFMCFQHIFQCFYLFNLFMWENRILVKVSFVCTLTIIII